MVSSRALKTLFLVASLLIFPVPLRAQKAPDLASGNRVRVTTATPAATVRIGTVQAFDGDTLKLRSAGSSIEIPRSVIIRIERSEGRKPNLIAGAIGLVIGAAADHEDELEQLVEEAGVPRIYAGDDLHENNLRILLTHMMEDPRKITAGMDMLLISGNLERIADMATNVAEEVVFLSKAGLSNTTPNGGTPVSFGDGECMRAYARDIRDSESGLRDLYESVR